MSNSNVYKNRMTYVIKFIMYIVTGRKNKYIPNCVESNVAIKKLKLHIKHPEDLNDFTSHIDITREFCQ